MAVAAVTESLDAVEQCAREALQSRGLTVTRILWVGSEAILFLGPQKRPMTAWVSRIGSQIRDVITESGFPAEPSAWVVRALGQKPGQRPDTTTSETKP